MENNIIKEIKKLKKDICPRPEWVTLSRDILLQQINPQKQYQAVNVGLAGYFQLFTQIFRQRLLEPVIIMLLVLGVFAVSSLTINAAFYSLPGDQLYRVKIALERTHVALIPSEEKKVELKMEFAQKRVAELDKIVAQVNVKPEVKKKRIEVVVQEFKNNVVAVSDHLNRITDQDKAQKVKMALAVSSKTEELAKSFDEKIEELPAIEKLEVEEIVAEAVQTAQDASLSAQQLAEDINQQSTAEALAEALDEEPGVVEGAEVDESADADEIADEIIEGVEASTTETSEEDGAPAEEDVEIEVDIQDSEENILETTEDIIE